MRLWWRSGGLVAGVAGEALLRLPRPPHNRWAISPNVEKLRRFLYAHMLPETTACKRIISSELEGMVVLWR